MLLNLHFIIDEENRKVLRIHDRNMKRLKTTFWNVFGLNKKKTIVNKFIFMYEN